MKKIIIFIICFLGFTKNCFSEVKIIASIPVIASIASKISGTPVKSIINDDIGGCVEGYSMKLSDILSAKDADLLILVGEGFEPFFHNIIKIKAENIKIFSINEKIPSLHKKDNTSDHKHHHENKHNKDYHFWLSPLNGLGIAFEITQYLSEINPEKASVYQDNFNSFGKELKSVISEINNTMKSHSKPNYLVSHDSLSYFEKYFNLPQAKSISSLQSGEISIKKAIEIQDNIKNNDISLILVIGASSPKSLRNILENFNIEIKNIDILGTKTKSKDSTYFDILRNIANNIFL